jgi:hypothetical protein
MRVRRQGGSARHGTHRLVLFGISFLALPRSRSCGLEFAGEHLYSNKIPDIALAAGRRCRCGEFHFFSRSALRACGCALTAGQGWAAETRSWQFKVSDSIALPRTDPQDISDLQRGTHPVEILTGRYVNQQANLHGACIEFCHGNAPVALLE